MSNNISRRNAIIGSAALFATLGSARPSLSRGNNATIASKVAQRALKSFGGTSGNDKDALSLRDFCATTSYGAWNVDYKYLQYLYETLEKVERGEIKRLIITLPVRHGKSEQGTVRFPIWFLSRDPTRRVAVASYNQTIANKFSRKARKIAKQFLDLSVERTAAEEWETVQGGTFRAVGVGGGLTGSGFDLLIADDTLKSREEAESETIREKIWDWYTDDFYTRREPGAAVVIISTRWHQDDLIGKILSSDTAHEWTVINLPAIAKENDILGRKPGEALCPERYPIEQLEHTKNIIGEYAFASLYQQDPIPHEGGHFKPGNIGRVDKLPEGRNFAFCRGWDMAASDMKGDYTVGVLMARDDQNTFYILDVVRERMAPDTRDQMIRDTAAKDKMMYGDGVLQMAQQDPAAAGKMQAVAFRKMLAGYRVATEPISGNKMVLSGPYASQMNGSNVYFVGNTRRSWEQPYMEEMALFPAGKHDDAVDASAVSFNALMRMHLVPPPEIKSDYTSPTKKYLERHNKQMAKTKWRRDYV